MGGLWNLIENYFSDEQSSNDQQEALSTNESRRRRKSKGLDNIGKTSYMNASLQCLSNTKDLREYFITRYEKSS